MTTSQVPRSPGGPSRPVVIGVGVLVAAAVVAVAAVVVSLLGGGDEADEAAPPSTEAAVDTTAAAPTATGALVPVEVVDDEARDAFIRAALAVAELTPEQARCLADASVELAGGDLTAAEAAADARELLSAGSSRALAECGVPLDAFKASGFGGLGSLLEASGPPPSVEVGDPGVPNDYGDDPVFDALWDACDAGDGVACDDLYWQTPIDTVYEEFGATCGGRYGFLEVTCASALAPGAQDAPWEYGDDPGLDDLWEACAAGDGVACDDLYWATPIGSRYEEFGATCGDRFGFREVDCATAGLWDGGGGAGLPFTYGDDPELDLLWEACYGGDGVACDDLYWATPVDSEYERVGATCGDRTGFLEIPCVDLLGP